MFLSKPAAGSVSATVSSASLAGTLPRAAARCLAPRPRTAAPPATQRASGASTKPDVGTPPLRVLISGGGVAGLALALALRERGVDALVFERVRAETIAALPSATGLHLWNFGLEALCRLSPVLEEQVLAHLVEAEADWPRPGPAAPGPLPALKRPQVLAMGDSVSRLELRGVDGVATVQHAIPPSDRSLCLAYGALTKAMRDALGPDAIRYDHSLEDWEEQPDGRTLALFTRRDAGEREAVVGDVLVGADGLSSRVRSRLFGGLASDPIDDAGATVWRGVVEARDVPPDLCPPGTSFCTHSADGRTLSVSSIGRASGSELHGGRLFWMLTQPLPEGARVLPVKGLADYRQPSSAHGRLSAQLAAGRSLAEAQQAAATPLRDVLLDIFSDFADARPLLAATRDGDFVERRLFHRGGAGGLAEDAELMARNGAVTLLGDAATSHLPALGLGANLALAAAARLADELAALPRGCGGAKLRDALRSFEAVQRGRAATLEAEVAEQASLVVSTAHDMLPCSAGAFSGWLLGNARRGRAMAQR